MLAAVGVLMAFAYRRRGEIFWVVMAVVGRDRRSCTCPRAASGTPACCPSTTWPCTWSARSAWPSWAARSPASSPSDVDRPPRVVLWVTALAVLGAWLIVLGAAAAHRCPAAARVERRRPTSGVRCTTSDSSFVTSWANWNFTGYEGKPYYPEYYAVVQTMAKVGQDHGLRPRHVGVLRATSTTTARPMALMLLPFWTNGCIGSMEGLYFEASATTPYHFLNQSELSTSAVRRRCATCPTAPTPLTQTDFDLGVSHLQMLGVRYYMASTTADDRTSPPTTRRCSRSRPAVRGSSTRWPTRRW